MRTITTGLAFLFACAAATPALAADVVSGSVQLGPSSATQLGRLSRLGVQQDWTGSEAYPGVTNPTTPYAYTAIASPFAPNAFQTVYYEINFDAGANADLFASAYLDTYDPLNKATNWLGDAGSSGNYFPGDPEYFDVVVPTGHALVLVVNSTVGTATTSRADYLVTAFSSTQYDEIFQTAAAVPEPATWGLMILGFAGIGAMLRRAPAGLRFAL